MSDETTITTTGEAIVETAIITDAERVAEAFVSQLDRSERTVETYAKSLRAFVSWLGENGIPVGDVQPSDVLAYKRSLMENHKPSTVNAYLTAVRQMYAWVEVNTGLRNPAATVEGVRGSHASATSKAHDALTVSQARAVISHEGEGLAGLRDQAIVNLMLRCGLRCVEVVRCDVRDLRTMGSRRILDVMGKGHTTRDTFVVLDDAAAEPIDRYLAARRAEYGELPEDAPLFVSEANRNRGKRMTTRSVSRICKQTMRAEGIDNDRISAHSLRHSAITYAVEGGATLLEAQSFARHADPRTTEIYIHANQRLKAVGESCVSAILDGTPAA